MIKISLQAKVNLYGELNEHFPLYVLDRCDDWQLVLIARDKGIVPDCLFYWGLDNDCWIPSGQCPCDRCRFNTEVCDMVEAWIDANQ